MLVLWGPWCSIRRRVEARIRLVVNSLQAFKQFSSLDKSLSHFVAIGLKMGRYSFKLRDRFNILEWPDHQLSSPRAKAIPISIDVASCKKVCYRSVLKPRVSTTGQSEQSLMAFDMAENFDIRLEERPNIIERDDTVIQ